jgi:alkylation response protein AidB-like acyl-CoA dehydrogenase
MTVASPAPAETSACAPPAEHVTVAGIRAAISPVLAELSKTARAREITRDYPFELVGELARARLLLVGVPARDGGAGGTVRDEVVIELARADSNVAQALRASFFTARQVASRQDLPHRQRTVERLRHGTCSRVPATSAPAARAARCIPPCMPPSAGTAVTTS